MLTRLVVKSLDYCPKGIGSISRSDQLFLPVFWFFLNQKFFETGCCVYVVILESDAFSEHKNVGEEL
jgi:hypothetical protein